MHYKLSRNKTFILFKKKDIHRSGKALRAMDFSFIVFPSPSGIDSHLKKSFGLSE